MDENLKFPKSSKFQIFLNCFANFSEAVVKLPEKGDKVSSRESRKVHVFFLPENYKNRYVSNTVSGLKRNSDEHPKKEIHDLRKIFVCDRVCACFIISSFRLP